MTKIICGNCKYHAYACGDHFCKHPESKDDEDMHFDGKNYFMDWCPLPDKEENGFMKWLDELIESMALDEEASNMATHEHHEYLGIIRGLQIVKDKVKELGL